MKLDKHLIRSVIMFKTYNHIEIISDLNSDDAVQRHIQKLMLQRPKEILAYYNRKRKGFKSFLN